MKKILSMIICSAMLLAVSFALLLPAYGEESEASEPLRYGRTTITEPDVKYTYDTLVTEMTKDTPTEEIVLSDSYSVDKNELKKAFALFVSDYPECFWVTVNYDYSHINGIIKTVYPNYSFTGAALTAAKAELENTVEGIISEMPSTTVYDKALYLHDTLAYNVVYEQVGEHQTAYGALVSGKAVCAGYAAAYQLLLHRAGIDAWTVAGYSNRPGDTTPISHAWNLVWLDRSTCVYTDVTWNDSEDTVFHYYFGMSKNAIANDHSVSSETYILPTCNHEDQGYFQHNSLTVNDSTTITELALMFDSPKGGARKGAFLYEGNSIDLFISKIEEDAGNLYRALGGSPSKCTASVYAIGNELQLIVNGDFQENTYVVTLSAGKTLNSYSETQQYVTVGTQMKDVSFFAVSGYYFPENYLQKTQNGITVTRISPRQIRASGTPARDVSIALTEASPMQKEATPQAEFFSMGEGKGMLTSVEMGMKYSFDKINWIDITDDRAIISSITGNKIFVMKLGDGATTLNSDIQALDVPYQALPEEKETELPEETIDETVSAEEKETSPKDSNKATEPLLQASDKNETVPPETHDRQTEVQAEDEEILNGMPYLGCKLSVNVIPAVITTAILCFAVIKKKKD